MSASALREGAGLRRVIIRRRQRRHGVVRPVAVAARADHPAHHHGRGGRLIDLAQAEQQFDAAPVDVVERRGIEAELGGPVRIGAPGRRVEHEADAAGAGEVDDSGCNRRATACGRPRPSSGSNEAKHGRSMPSWKIKVVSMPPSIRKTVSESRGRLLRYLAMTAPWHCGRPLCDIDAGFGLFAAAASSRHMVKLVRKLIHFAFTAAWLKPWCAATAAQHKADALNCTYGRVSHAGYDPAPPLGYP